MSDDPLSLTARAGLPEALRVLLADFPREDWAGDPGFSDLVQFWLERHGMFRRLLTAMGEECAARVAGTLDPEIHASHLNRYGGMFLQGLHEHHMIEDHQYFPRLQAFDPRLERGFHILDRDHHDIDAELSAFRTEASAVLAEANGGNLGRFHDQLARMERLLDRHLEDEEDLIVPVLLKYVPSGVL